MSTTQPVTDPPALHDYATGDYIRTATSAERDESYASGHEGVIVVDGRNCYVVD